MARSMIDDEEQDITQAIANEGSVEKERYEKDVLRDKVFAPYTEWRRSQETAATRRGGRNVQEQPDKTSSTRFERTVLFTPASRTKFCETSM